MARERMTFVRVPEWTAQANTLMQRLWALADGSTRTDVKSIAVTGTLTLTWPFTLCEVDTTAAAVTVTLPDPATVPGYRVDALRVAGANTATVGATVVTTGHTFISTGAVWRVLA